MHRINNKKLERDEYIKKVKTYNAIIIVHIRNMLSGDTLTPEPIKVLRKNIMQSVFAVVSEQNDLNVDTHELRFLYDNIEIINNTQLSSHLDHINFDLNEITIYFYIQQNKVVVDDLNKIKHMRFLNSANNKVNLRRLRDILPHHPYNRTIALAAVLKNGLALEHALNFKDDKELVLAAISQCGIALRYASKRLREDMDVVLAAVRQNCFALEFVSRGLIQNKRVVLTAVSQDSNALYKAFRNAPKYSKPFIREYLEYTNLNPSLMEIWAQEELNKLNALDAATMPASSSMINPAGSISGSSQPTLTTMFSETRSSQPIINPDNAPRTGLGEESPRL